MDKAKLNHAKLFPHVVAAFFCEKALTEADGVLSTIRIVDIIQIKNPPKAVKKKGIMMTNLLFVLMIRAGNYRGKAIVQIHVVNPSGKREKAAKHEIDLGDSPEKGINSVSPTAIRWDKPGVYWFEVYVNGKRLARSPLVIKIQPESQTTESKKSKNN